MGKATAVKQEIDGVVIADGLSKERIIALADRLAELAEVSRKAEKIIGEKRSTVADAMLSIARDCEGIKEFDTSYSLATIRYKAKHRSKAVPKVMTQTASDIRRMYSQGVDLKGIDAETGEVLTYSKLKGKASKQQREAVNKAREAIESTKPDYLKRFEGLVSLFLTFAVNRQTEQYFVDCKVFEEINELLSNTAKEWTKEHPPIVESVEDTTGDDSLAEAA